LSQVLALKGYGLIDTDNGQDAVKRARYAPPDLVLVDLDVPLLYGLVAARQIVKQAQLGALPVVVITREDTVDPYPMMELGAPERICHQGRRLRAVRALAGLPITDWS